MEEIPMESAPIAKPETPKKKNIENKEKTISLSIDKKIFTIEFKNEIEYLSIVASYQGSLFPVKYIGKFTLSDIKKVGLFRDYESIDECLYDIFKGLNSNPTIIEKDNIDIIITVPLFTRKYPEITFTLKKEEKNESQKYDELVNILLNMKNEKDKEIKELKNKVENLEKLLNLKNKKKENTEESEEQFDGTKIELFNIGKDEYFDYFPDKSQYKENIKGIISITVECNERDIQDVVDSFNKYKNDIKGILDFNDYDQKYTDLHMRINMNKIIIDLITYNEIDKDSGIQEKKDLIFDENISDETYPLLMVYMANELKIGLKSKINLVDISEIKDEEKINNLFYNTNIYFKGDTILYKIILGFLLIGLHLINDKEKQNDKENDKENNENDNDKENNDNENIKIIKDLVIDIFLNVINGKLNYTLNNKELLDNFKGKEKFIFSFIKYITIKTVNLFKDPKYRVFQKINFNKIKLGLCGSPRYNVGLLGVNFESPKNNEFIDKVLNGKITLEEEKKENSKDGEKIEEN